MTIPFVHKAAVRNSCQWSFFPNHHLLSVHAAQTFLGAVVTSLIGQREEKSCTFPTRFPSSSASPQGSCSSPAFPELQLQSICISSSDTDQSKHAHSFPCYCTKALRFILFMCLKQHKSQNPKSTWGSHSGVTQHSPLPPVPIWRPLHQEILYQAIFSSLPDVNSSSEFQKLPLTHKKLE